MLRGFFAVTCLIFALSLAAGCGGQTAGGGPRLANPNDPKVKDLAPVPVGVAPASPTMMPRSRRIDA